MPQSQVSTNNTQNSRISPEEVEQSLAKIKAQRGYVLPSHTILASTLPDVLQAYEAVFAAINNKQYKLTRLEKSFVWIVVVGCSEVPIGGHHVRDFVDSGGESAQIEAAAVLSMLAASAGLIDTVGPGWKKVVPDLNLRSAYERAVLASAPSMISTGVVHAALAAGHACRRAWDLVSFHIVRAKESGMSDEGLAEALTVVVLPAGNPSFVQACEVWAGLVRDGRVKASANLDHALHL